MPILLWDASALVKRYAQERGSDTVQALLDAAPALPYAITALGYAETFSILLRRFNAGVIQRASFETAAEALRLEILHGRRTRFVALDDEILLAGLRLIRAHNLNASDAAILHAFIRYAGMQRATGTESVLIAADHRLLRAAEAEGLQTLDPETSTPEQAIALATGTL